MIIETIYGQIVAKANHYMSVPGKGGAKRIIKDEVIRAYERNFIKQCKTEEVFTTNYSSIFYKQ